MPKNKKFDIEIEGSPPKIDQDKVDRWYTVSLFKKYNTKNPDELRAAAIKHKVTTSSHMGRYGQVVTIRDGKLNIIAQRPISYFYLPL